MVWIHITVWIHVTPHHGLDPRYDEGGSYQSSRGCECPSVHSTSNKSVATIDDNQLLVVAKPDILPSLLATWLRSVMRN